MCPRDLEKQENGNVNGEDQSFDSRERQQKQRETTDEKDVGVTATPEMCFYCFDLLINELLLSSRSRDGKSRSSKGAGDRTIGIVPSPSSSSSSSSVGIAMGGKDDTSTSTPTYARTVPSSFECPIFVTWDKKRRQSSDEFDLRGCIGTLTPRPLRTAIGDYTLTSALRDRRFDPIRKDEVPNLRVAVSLLVKYEECSDCYDWIVGTHGIIIKFSAGSINYSATYLPEVAKEQGWNQQEAIRSLIKKSGYRGSINDDLLKRRLRCTKYQSSKHKLTYQEYVTMLNGKDPIAEYNTENTANTKTRGWRPSFFNL